MRPPNSPRFTLLFRIVVLDNDLNQKAVYDHVGAPWGICVSPGPHQYLYSSNSAGTTIDARELATTGEIYKMELDGTVVGRFGTAGVAPKEFASIHMMDCRFPNEIYTAEIQGWRVQKIRLRPRKAASSRCTAGGRRRSTSGPAPACRRDAWTTRPR